MAHCGPCQVPERYVGVGGGVTAASQSGHQKSTLSAVGLPLLLGTGLGSGSFTALTASHAPTQPCPVLHPASPIPKRRSPCCLGPQAVL